MAYREAELLELHFRDKRNQMADKMKMEPSEIDDLLNTLAYKEVTERARREAARRCMEVIDIAFTHGVVSEGQGLAGKLNECEELSRKQAQELLTVSRAYEQVQTKLKGMQQRFGVDKKTLR